MRVTGENTGENTGEEISHVATSEYCFKEVKGAEDWILMVCHENQFLFWARVTMISK